MKYAEQEAGFENPLFRGIIPVEFGVPWGNPVKEKVTERTLIPQ